MLIEKHSAPVVNDIVSLKLVSGEEIIGRLVEQNREHIIIAKPMRVILQACENGVSFAQALAAADRGVSLTIMTAALAVRPVKANQHIIADYIKSTE
jgi:hypothetical protein